MGAEAGVLETAAVVRTRGVEIAATGRSRCLLLWLLLGAASPVAVGGLLTAENCLSVESLGRLAQLCS